MSGCILDVDVIEREREEVLISRIEQLKWPIAKLKTSAKPGTVTCHESLHSVYLCHNFVQSALCGHPTIITNPNWYIRSRQITYLLKSLYDDIYKEHFNAESVPY